MKSLQPIGIAFVVALVIVSVSHLMEFAGWVAQIWFVLQSFLWAMKQPVAPSKSEFQEEQIQEPTQEQEPPSESEIVAATEETEVVSPTGTVAKLSFATDAFEMKTESATETVQKIPVQLDKFFVEQLESLPKKKGRRQAWANLCQTLQLKGGAKVRDANVQNRAKFLVEHGVKAPDLVKAKVRTLTMEA